MKGETNKIKQENSAVKNQGRGGYLGRGRGRGRGGGSFTGKSNIQCRYCKKFGHTEFECWTKQKNEQKHANLTETLQEDNHLFMAQSSIEAASGDIWFAYSGCLNHMSRTRSLLKEVDESQNSDVTLPNGTLINIEG